MAKLDPPFSEGGEDGERKSEESLHRFSPRGRTLKFHKTNCSSIKEIIYSIKIFPVIHLG